MGVVLPTLGLLKVTLLDARLQGFVEERVELSLGGDGDVVVGLDVLFDSLSAVRGLARVADDEDEG